jgi:hypothetical protein
MDEGERIVYFHGTPGSPDELLLFPASGLTGCNRLWVLPRHDHHNGLSSDQYFDALASEQRIFQMAQSGLSGFPSVHLLP